MASTDAVEIILSLRNLQRFVAGSREAATAVRGIGTAAKEGQAEAAAGSRRWSGIAGLASTAMKGSAAGLALMAVEGTKMAVNFDKQMEMIHTQAGASQASVGKLSGAILDMSKSGQYAQGPEDLAKGLFHLVSIGMKPAQALNALKVAAQGAAVGNANLEDTTTALGSAWLAGIKGAGSFNHVMALANATVGAGNMRMQNLVESLGTGVLPSAKLAGLGIKDVFSAMAILSDEGYKGSSAMAQFATALHFITDPGKKAAGSLKEIGLGQFTLAETMRKHGLQATLKELQTHLAKVPPVKREQIMGDILPAGRGRVLSVLLNQADRLGLKMHQINKISKQFGDDVAKTHATASFKIHAAWSQVQADLITLGHVLEPVGVAAAQAFAKFVTWLIKIPSHIRDVIKWWNNLSPVVKMGAEFVGLFTGAMLTFFAISKGIEIVTVLWEALTGAIEIARIAMYVFVMDNPLLLAGAALIAITVLVITHWKQVGHIISDAWKWLKRAFQDSIHFLVGFVKAHWTDALIILLTGPFGWIIVLFKNFGPQILKWVKHGISTVVGFLTSHWQQVLLVLLTGPFGWIYLKFQHFFDHDIVGFIKSLPAKIAAAAHGMWDGIWTAFKTVINLILGGLQFLIRHIGIPGFHVGPVHFGGIHPFGSVTIPKMEAGGEVVYPGAALVGERGAELINLPRGATVRPLESSRARTPMPLLKGKLPDVVVQVDRREIARANGKYTSDREARR